MNPANAINAIIDYGLIFLIVFTPFAFGSVHVWAYTIVEVVVLLLLLIWLLTSRASFLAPHSPRLAFLLFLVLILFQMVPLPTTVMQHLSPNTYDLYQQTLETPLNVKKETFNVTPHSSPLTPHPSHLAPRSLSIYTHATKTEFLKFLAYLSVFFLVIRTITTKRQIRRMVLAIISTGTGVAFLALCQILSKSDKIYGFWQSQQALHKIGIYGGQVGKIGSYGGPFINPNHLAGYLEMVIPLALGFLLSRETPGIIRSVKNWKQRIILLEPWLAKNMLLFFMIVLMTSALFISASRGGIISFVFSFGLFCLLLGVQRAHQRKRKMVLLITGLIFIFLLWVGIGPVVTGIATLTDPKTSGLMHRLQVSKDTLSLSQDFPFFGVGLGNFQTLYPKYQTFTYPFIWDHAHNDYVEMLADTGWIGLLLFFGGIGVVLLTIFKKWTQKQDPFLALITLGGIIGAVSLLCHCLVEFNFHIPANAFLFFVILGLGVVAVNHPGGGEEKSSVLRVRAGSFSSKIKIALIAAEALVVAVLLTVVIKDYLAYRFFLSYQSPSEEQGPQLLIPLKRAIFFDSGNASYRYELGNYYARKMSESWEQQAANISGDQWIADAGENTRFFGLKALQAYADAVNLSPANARYHFYRGWIMTELKRFSDFSNQPVPISEPCDAETELYRALMLNPNNQDMKKYITTLKSGG